MKKHTHIMQKLGAEAFGTMILTLTVFFAVAGLGSQPLIIGILAGLVLMLFVYTIGHISGTHINPGVTIGALMVNKISWKRALGYIAAQFAGAGLAIAIASGFIPNTPGFAQVYDLIGNGNSIADLDTAQMLRILFAEIIGMVIFTFGIASVVFGRAPKGASGVVIGGSLFMGIMVAVLLGSGGILNPAVALGLNSLNAMYILGPIIGSIFGFWLFYILDTDLHSRKKDHTNTSADKKKYDFKDTSSDSNKNKSNNNKNQNKNSNNKNQNKNSNNKNKNNNKKK